VHFQSITDGVDTKTPAGRFFFHVMASLAQMERELILERTRAGLEAARCQGRVGGRKRRMTDGKVQAARKLLGRRDAAARGSAQLRRVGPYVISMGIGLFADIRLAIELDHSVRALMLKLTAEA
jgi:DNA invertase Pin-like site-specific DNA recombinase